MKFKKLEKILKSFIWSKYSSEKELPMVSCEICSIPKEEGDLRLIDVETQGHILATKWISKCLEGSAPWKILLHYRLKSCPTIVNPKTIGAM